MFDFIWFSTDVINTKQLIYIIYFATSFRVASSALARPNCQWSKFTRYVEHWRVCTECIAPLTKIGLWYFQIGVIMNNTFVVVSSWYYTMLCFEQHAPFTAIVQYNVKSSKSIEKRSIVALNFNSTLTCAVRRDSLCVLSKLNYMNLGYFTLAAIDLKP